MSGVYSKAATSGFEGVALRDCEAALQSRARERDATAVGESCYPDRPVLHSLLAIAPLWVASPSPASPVPIEVVWSGEHCTVVDFESLLRDEIERRGGAAAPRRVEASLRRLDDGSHELLLVLEGGPTRRFVAPTCSTVIEAAAFVAATTQGSVAETSEAPRDPGLAIPEPQPEEEPPSTASTGASRDIAMPRASSRPPQTESVSRARRRPAGRGYVALVPQVSGGALPEVGFVASVEVGVLFGRLRVFATGGYRTPGEARSRLDPAAGGRFSQWFLGASGCFEPRRRSFGFPLCAGLEGGQVMGRGFGFEGATSTTAPWLALPLSASISWVPRRVGIRVGAAVVPVLVRPEWVIEDLETLFRPGPVDGRAFVALEARF